MHALERKVEKIVTAEKLLAKGERVVVGLSAGPDSLALWHLLVALAGPFRLTVIAAYADHGLRPSETEAEVRLVRETAAAAGMACEIGTLPVRDYARAEGLSLEHAGRELRYRFLREVAQRHGASRIAVGHTADDQAEELLLRLIRGTGRKGLSGMVVQSGEIIRPLLAIPKEELLAYLADRDIAFCRDSSNTDRRYLRNRVRLELLPWLESHCNPNVRQTLRQTAAVLQDEEAVLAELTATAWAQVATTHGQELRVQRAALLAQPVAIQRRLMEQAMVQCGSAPSFRLIDQLLRLAMAPEPGRLHLAKGLRVWRQSGTLCFAHPQGHVRQRGDLLPPASSFRLVVPAPGRYPLPATGRVLVVEQCTAPPTHPAPGVLLLDAAAAAFPLLVRSVSPGDRFHPLGAPGRRKLSDFFIDQKIPAAERWQVPVVVAADGRIVALAGMRIDQAVKVTEQTTATVCLSLVEI
ncbi:MAG TPA: tRNA lysidine(34) synthetase TilS [Desulfurivibrionaceae bacterium]|nr:tRNA lysidine(34) synthetase TilS [Desulfurivibrionaceae bacterium]